MNDSKQTVNNTITSDTTLIQAQQLYNDATDYFRKLKLVNAALELSIEKDF